MPLPEGSGPIAVISSSLSPTVRNCERLRPPPGRTAHPPRRPANAAVGRPPSGDDGPLCDRCSEDRFLGAVLTVHHRIMGRVMISAVIRTPFKKIARLLAEQQWLFSCAR